MVVAEQDIAVEWLMSVAPWNGYVGHEQHYGSSATFAVSVAMRLDRIAKAPATEDTSLAIRDALDGVTGSLRADLDRVMLLGTNEEPVCY